MIAKDLLRKIGLSENEALVYMTVLRLWVAPIGSMLRATALSRATLYDTVDRLVKRGCLFKTEQSGVARYWAADPDVFLARMQSDIDDLEQKMRLFSKNISSVTQLRQDSSRVPIIRTYEWLEWIRQVYDEHLEAEETVRAYVNMAAMEQTIGKTVQAFLKKREKKKIHAKGLILKTPEAFKIAAGYDPRYTEFRWFPTDITPGFDLELSMFDGKIIYMTFRDVMPIAVVIEDMDIYRLHCATFDAIWAGAEK